VSRDPLTTSAEAFLDGSELALATFRWIRDLIPEAEVSVTKSQIAFRARRAFAWLWRPQMYLGARGADVALSIALPRRDPSPRWKEVVRPSTRAWVHHLELERPEELDVEVATWLREAAAAAAASAAPAAPAVTNTPA
jgi:hypothetical protein